MYPKGVGGVRLFFSMVVGYSDPIIFQLFFLFFPTISSISHHGEHFGSYMEFFLRYLACFPTGFTEVDHSTDFLRPIEFSLLFWYSSASGLRLC